MNPLDILQNSLGMHPVLFGIVLIWVTAWKGVALWKAAHKEQRNWFIALLILNTFGILEILYIFVFSDWKKRKEQKKEVESHT